MWRFHFIITFLSESVGSTEWRIRRTRFLPGWQHHSFMRLHTDCQKATVIEHTCAYARWAHMHHFTSVRPSVVEPKFRLENNSYMYLKNASNYAYFDTWDIALAGGLTSMSNCLILYVFFLWSLLHFVQLGYGRYQKEFVSWANQCNLSRNYITHVRDVPGNVWFYYLDKVINCAGFYCEVILSTCNPHHPVTGSCLVMTNIQVWKGKWRYISASVQKEPVAVSIPWTGHYLSWWELCKYKLSTLGLATVVWTTELSRGRQIYVKISIIELWSQ